MIRNSLCQTDCYKWSHLVQHPENTTEIYAYLEARKPNHNIVWFGLQHYLKEYLLHPFCGPNNQSFNEFAEIYKSMLGPIPKEVYSKIESLFKLGYFPLSIKSLPEGTVVNSQNVLMTVKNTHPDFSWVVGFLETLLLKVWYPCTVATFSNKFKQVATKYSKETCENDDHIPFCIHDFGYRSSTSEESAQIGGAAHLVNFNGTDTISAIPFIKKYYTPKNPNTLIGASISATEHAVQTFYGREREYEMLDRILDIYPNGFVSVVSDSYDYWNVLINYLPSRKDRILSREGKYVVRPDSSKKTPLEIICGDPESLNDSEKKGSLELLWETFGGTYNSKGYRVLNPKIGLIYGEGITLERYEKILETMKQQKFASSNLVCGVGGILLQNHNRDEYGFAFKCTSVVENGKRLEVFKDPVTDPGKKSKKGLMQLLRNEQGYYTIDQCTEAQEAEGELVEVFRDGQILKQWSIEEVRENVNNA